MNFRYPVFLDLAGKKCLVTGAGYEVPAKVKALVDASAIVTYVHPEAHPDIADLAAQNLIVWEKRGFQASDLADCFLLITDQDNNSEAFRLAEEQKILCNAVDDPEHCRFTFGSVHRQGDLTIAISTNGRAPALAVRLRQKLEREIGSEYGALLALLKQIRPEINAAIGDFDARRNLWYQIIDSDVLARLKNGDEAGARTQIQSLIQKAISSTSDSDISGDISDR